MSTEQTEELIQIGWVTDAIVDEVDLESFIAQECHGTFGPDVSALDDYEADNTINHSHGPITKPIPVYIKRSEVWR